MVGLSEKLNDDTNAFVNEVKRENNQKVAEKTNTVKGLPEATALRVTNIRKTSISMPSNLDEMDDLRIDRQNVSEIYILYILFYIFNFLYILTLNVIIFTMRSYY